MSSSGLHLPVVIRPTLQRNPCCKGAGCCDVGVHHVVEQVEDDLDVGLGRAVETVRAVEPSSKFCLHPHKVPIDHAAKPLPVPSPLFNLREQIKKQERVLFRVHTPTSFS
jgi:hypothetical protein